MSVGSDQIAHARHEPNLVRAVLVGFAVGLFLGALFQSQALLTLSYDLDPGMLSDSVVPLAEAWHAAMQELGFASLSQMITDSLEGFRSLPVSEEE